MGVVTQSVRAPEAGAGGWALEWLIQSLQGRQSPRSQSNKIQKKKKKKTWLILTGLLAHHRVTGYVTRGPATREGRRASAEASDQTLPKAGPACLSKVPCEEALLLMAITCPVPDICNALRVISLKTFMLCGFWRCTQAQSLTLCQSPPERILTVS